MLARYFNDGCPKRAASVLTVNCELREFAKSDGMPVYTIVGEVLLDNLDQHNY